MQVKMLLYLLLLVQCVDRIVSQGIVFKYRDRYEGDRCELPNKRTGICRKDTACPAADTANLRLCAGTSVICCDVIRQQCEDAKAISDAALIFHIVGVAETAEVGEFPFMALVEYDNELIRCGAAIISKRFLVTAAHCHTSEAKMLRVRLGTVEANDADAVTVEIANFYSHPGFARMKKQNDIALIELKQDIEMNENIKPVCLYDEAGDIPERTDLIVMGWGVEAKGDSSKVLLKGTVQPVLRSSCQVRYSKLGFKFDITEKHMCALGTQRSAVDDKVTDACQGDSGGPLVLKKDDYSQLVGIVSTGSGCGVNAGLYTRVSRYLDWIVEMGVWNRSRIL